ncbi:hypothetical protein MUO79_03685, partial [Candidatus Bathyarchaeota archaeon]|nr:hypothetical protein [Candidatus Bathyarchaeota archaeon]
MTMDSKRKLLFIMFLLMLLLVSSAYTTLIPNVHAAEMTIQQKGLSILSDVVGLDLARYDVTTKEYQQELQVSYLGVVPQKSVSYNLESGENKLKIFYTFAKGNLQMIQVLENEGAPSLTKPRTSTNTFAAKSFLTDYQTYTADSLYGELRSTLDNVGANKNITKISGNTQLNVSAIDGYTTFKWTYIFNGVTAPSRFIAMGFKNGFLTAFVDNWNLYSIGGTSVNLSKEEAVAIALDSARRHSWSVQLEEDTLDVKNLNEKRVSWSTLIFDGSLNADKARSEDPLRLYPVWRVGVTLNKWYGDLYGIEVDIWADTGEVRSVQEAWSTLPPPEDNSTANVNSQASANLAMLITFPTVAAATGAIMVLVKQKKKLHTYNLLKRSGLKAGGILLCILISSIILFAPIATVNATTRGAAVWGSESTGAWNNYLQKSWRKSPTEVYWQRLTAANISIWFGNNGYYGNNGINHQGIRNPGSSKSQILTDIMNLRNTYDYVAVVDFDHGVGGYPWYAPPGELHYMFEDN